MEPMDYLVAVRRNGRLIALLTAAGIVLGLLIAFVPAPDYRAKATVLLAPNGVVQESELGQVNSFIGAHVHSYAQLTNSPKVLEPVLRENQLSMSTESFAENVTTEVPIDTHVIEISVVDSDPDQAATLANAVARHLTTTVSEVAPLSVVNAPSVALKTVGVATAPTHAESPNKLLLVAVGGAGGLFLALLYAVGRHGVTMRQETNSASRTAAGEPQSRNVAPSGW